MDSSPDGSRVLLSRFSESASCQAKPATPQVPLSKPTQGKQTNEKVLPHSHFLIDALLFRWGQSRMDRAPSFQGSNFSNSFYFSSNAYMIFRAHLKVLHLAVLKHQTFKFFPCILVKLWKLSMLRKKLKKIPINFVCGACAFGGLGHRRNGVGDHSR